MATHTGHRRRMKDKFRRDSFDVFADHEVLETLLYYSVPMRDTNPIAHALLEKGGSLFSVCHMTETEISKIPYCTHRTALLLRMLCEIGARALREPENAPVYHTLSSIRALALEVASKEEETVAVLFDNQYRVVKIFTAWQGYYASAAFRASLVAEPALLCHASSVMLVSTHVNHIPRPDPYERAATRYLSEALSFVGIHLVEHFIVSGTLVTSAKDTGASQGGACYLRENAPVTGEETENA